MSLRDIYLEALARCAPEVLVRPLITPDMPRNVVAIGKCAGALLDGVAEAHPIEHAFAVIPAGYRAPKTTAQLHIGGHPQMTPASFAAGRALLDFVDAHDDLLFLISGGGSACVEVALPPYTEEEVMTANANLIAQGLPIAAINEERRKRSAIKGGRLGERVRGRCVALVHSDVSSGRLQDVASGPVLRNLQLIADNTTLVRAAASLVDQAIVIDQQIETSVEEAARFLATEAKQLRPGQTLVAGGEPTVKIRGDGKGGRCIELAVRFALEMEGTPYRALFASSDGIDGNSGVAGLAIDHAPPALDRGAIGEALGCSNSMAIATQVGEPIMIAPAGNNLRDLFLVARD